MMNGARRHQRPIFQHICQTNSEFSRAETCECRVHLGEPQCRHRENHENGPRESAEAKLGKGSKRSTEQCGFNCGSRPPPPPKKKDHWPVGNSGKAARVQPRTGAHLVTQHPKTYRQHFKNLTHRREIDVPYKAPRKARQLGNCSRRG